MSRSTDGNIVTLRGHSALAARACRWLGLATAVGTAVAIYGYATHPSDTTAAGVSIAGALVSAGLLVWSRLRLAKPDRHLVVDFAAQTVLLSSFGADRGPLSFHELGPMSLDSITIASTRGTGERAQMHQAVVGLSKHPGVVLYQPSGNTDLLCFVATLRELIGEEYLPRAAPKLEGSERRLVAAGGDHTLLP